jgi:dolichol kinase
MNANVLTGVIRGAVIERNGKLQVLSRILAAEKLSPSECAVVADDRNNAAIFLRETRKVGYNPDFRILLKADAVVTGKLSKILSAVNGQPPPRSLPLRNDALREIIHASGALIPVICTLTGVFAFALLTCVICAAYVVSELLRMEGKNLPLVSIITRHAASQTELHEFTAAPLYFATGILLTLLLFQTPVSSAAIAIFALGDSSASIFGNLVPVKSLPFNKNKTLGGSLAGVCFAALAGAFFVSPVYALIGAAIAMTIECLPLPINDNVLMPLCTAAALTLII